MTEFKKPGVEKKIKEKEQKKRKETKKKKELEFDKSRVEKTSNLFSDKRKRKLCSVKESVQTLLSKKKYIFFGGFPEKNTDINKSFAQNQK